MKCACGLDAKPNEICEACGRKNQKCPACDGDISLMPQTLLLECPYCGTALHRLEAGTTPYYPVNFNKIEMEERLLDFLLNRFGIPDNFSQKFRVLSSRLSFVPIHLYNVQAWLNKDIVEVDMKGVVLTKQIWYREHLNRYRFAVRVSQVMNIANMNINTYKIDLSTEDAESVATKYGDKLLKKDIKRFSEIYRDTKIQHTSVGEVYYPFYEVFYKYGGTRYRSVVDAASGVVSFSEHPMCWTSRAMVMGSAALLFVMSFFAAIVFGFMGSYLAPVVVVGIAAIASLRVFWMSIRSHSGKEALAVDSTSMDILGFQAHMPGLQRKIVMDLDKLQQVYDEKLEVQISKFYTAYVDGELSEERFEGIKAKYALLSKVHQAILLYAKDGQQEGAVLLQEICATDSFKPHVQKDWDLYRKETKSSENVFVLLDEMESVQQQIREIRDPLKSMIGV